MTDITLIKSENATLAARLRAGLGGIGLGGLSAQAVARALRLGGRDEDRLARSLERAWGASARAQVSLVAMAVEIEDFGALEARVGRATAERHLQRVQRALDGCLRQSDRSFRHGRTGLVAVLPDCPMLLARRLAHTLSKSVGAIGFAERGESDGLSVAIGLAAINPQGAYDPALFKAAIVALGRAREEGCGRIEAVDLRPLQSVSAAA